MGFRMLDIVGQRPEVATYRCPSGKTVFPSKQAARQAVRGMHGHRTRMEPFRCGFCDKYHLGHRRGAVI